MGETTHAAARGRDQNAEYRRLSVRNRQFLLITYQEHVAGINRANGSDMPVGERLYGAERTLSAGFIWSF